MALKIRIPEPGEERLTWQKGVLFRICTQDGYQDGLLDLQWAILDAEDLNRELFDEDSHKLTSQFVAERLRGVKGLKDEQGEEWPEEEQIRFVSKSSDTVGTAFKAYLEHTTTGDARKNSSRPSDGRSMKRHNAKH